MVRKNEAKLHLLGVACATKCVTDKPRIGAPLRAIDSASLSESLCSITFCNEHLTHTAESHDSRVPVHCSWYDPGVRVISIREQGIWRQERMGHPMKGEYKHCIMW